MASTIPDRHDVEYAINEIQNRVKPHDLEGVASLETIKEYISTHVYTREDIEKAHNRGLRRGLREKGQDV